jgi:DNA-directed RNA polymerase subunit RPC12/RpoP
MKKLCLKCGHDLSIRGNLFGETGNKEIDSARTFTWTPGYDDGFIACPYCGAKNMTVLKTSKDGKPYLEIIRVEE